MRVGPGNILGVTGAISTGGPGALFWMWISAFFGMSTAFVEATLSQIFKERKDDEYVGGLPFYGRRLLKNAAWAGAALSVLYIIYAFLCFPAQGFNTISAVGAIAGKGSEAASAPAAAPAPAPVPAAPAAVVFEGIDETQAACVMAIVSHETGIPLDELVFKSIKAV